MNRMHFIKYTNLTRWIVLCAIVSVMAGAPLALTTPVDAGEKVEFRLKDGSRFTGEIGDKVRVTAIEPGTGVEHDMKGTLVEAADLYIVIKTDIAGEMRNKTIFKGDISAMERLGSGKTAEETNEAEQDSDTGLASDQSEVDEKASGNEKGVYVLPLRGMVGTYITADLIKKIGKHADERGPGQIIVLIVDTNGGLVIESDKITEAIFDLRERHRVVAWVHKAISAGATMAICCPEIYFMTEGICGSVTTVRGKQGMKGAQLEMTIEKMAELCQRSGYSPHIGRAMKANKEMCSYDKNEETGEVTFYGDLSGEYVLSDPNSNLNFNASNALHCRFSKGTADTGEELAEHLDLKEWNKIDDFGEELSEDWHRTVDRAQEEIPRLLARYNYYKTGSGDPVQIIGARIQIIKELIKWWDRCPNVCYMTLGNLTQYRLERELKELKKQLADIRRERRRQ